MKSVRSKTYYWERFLCGIIGFCIGMAMPIYILLRLELYNTKLFWIIEVGFGLGIGIASFYKGGWLLGRSVKLLGFISNVVAN